MELQTHIEEFAAAGVRVVAVAPEPVRRIARFTEEFGITFPILADEDSAVIRRYGILNTLIDLDEDRYGIPFPGTYLTDTTGRIVQKFFNQHYRIRESAAHILRGELDVPVDMTGYPSAEPEVGVSAQLGSGDIKPYQRVDILVRVELDEGLHTYGHPAPAGYVPTTVAVTGPEGLVVEDAVYPPTTLLRIPGLDEELPIFEDSPEVRVPVVYTEYGAEPGTILPIDIEVRYQACDDLQCFVPQRARLRLEAPVGANLRATTPRPQAPAG